MYGPTTSNASNPIKNQRHIEPPQKPTWGNKMKKNPNSAIFLGEQLRHNYHTLFNVWCPQFGLFHYPFFNITYTVGPCYSQPINSTYRGEIAPVTHAYCHPCKAAPNLHFKVIRTHQSNTKNMRSIERCWIIEPIIPLCELNFCSDRFLGADKEFHSSLIIYEGFPLRKDYTQPAQTITSTHVPGKWRCSPQHHELQPACGCQVQHHAAELHPAKIQSLGHCVPGFSPNHSLVVQAGAVALALGSWWVVLRSSRVIKEKEVRSFSLQTQIFLKRKWPPTHCHLRRPSASAHSATKNCTPWCQLLHHPKQSRYLVQQSSPADGDSVVEGRSLWSCHASLTVSWIEI